MTDTTKPFKAIVRQTELREFRKTKPVQAINADGLHSTRKRLPLYVCKTDQGETLLAMWSGMKDVPAKGAVIDIKINSIGPATVHGWFVEYGYLGVLAAPHNPPDWWIKQNEYPSLKNCSHVFGPEIKGF